MGVFLVKLFMSTRAYLTEKCTKKLGRKGIFRKLFCGTEEIIRSAKCLHFHHEDLPSDPQHPHKKLGKQQAPKNPSTGEAKPGRTLELPGQLAYLSELRFSERPYVSRQRRTEEDLHIGIHIKLSNYVGLGDVSQKTCQVT